MSGIVMAKQSAARAARDLAGLSLLQAARRARVSPAYLAQVERRGAPYCLATRLAAISGCSLEPVTDSGRAW
jgi:transcriptional regulator with XRE-family HTH domain